jgi:hypothetical protein
VDRQPVAEADEGEAVERAIALLKAKFDPGVEEVTTS